MADRRYGSTAWKRLRLQVLHRDEYHCRIQGPGCVGIARSVHHVIPSSEAPHLFFEPSNLVAACTVCNCADGANLTNENRRNSRERIAELTLENQRLERVVAAQENRIDELALALAAARNTPKPEPAPNRAQPAIR